MKTHAVVWLAVTLVAFMYHQVNALRPEHFAMGLAMFGLWWPSLRTRHFVLCFAPLVAYAFVYDALRAFADAALGRVSIAPVHQLELALFGWHAQHGPMGPVDFFARHHALWADILGAMWYSTHVAVILGYAAWQWWRAARPVPFLPPGGGGEHLARFLWGFLGLNLVGFAIQVAYPVAPPWYVARFGYELPTVALVGDPAGLARVDAWLGIPYFANIYASATYVFGALPSLHVAYPVWLALMAGAGGSRRVSRLAWIYALFMGFFAVYLGHHYLIDVLAGAMLAVGAYAVLERTTLGQRLGTWSRRAEMALLVHSTPLPVTPATAPDSPRL